MKLLKFKVSSAFRNLNGLTIKFDKEMSTYVVIGTNGAGKSNVLEALSSVFKTLYYDPSHNFEFGFYLSYEISGRKILLIYAEEKHKFVIKVDGQPIDGGADSSLSQYLPSRVVCNYSGEDSRIYEFYYKEPRELYTRALIQATTTQSLQMMFVNKDYWKIIFVVMCCCKNQNQAFESFLSDTLGIKSIDPIRLSVDPKELGKWGVSAPALYLRQLLERMGNDTTASVEQFNPNEEDATTIYNNLVGVYGLIKDGLEITYNGGINTTLFSEGEKKMMVVLFMLEALSDEKSLLLLDEPDSHIHVAQKGKLVTLLTGTGNRENLITTHSPSLTTQFKDEAIIMLSANESGCAEVVDKDKAAIVKELTNDMWSLQEQNIFLNSNQDILLVEGKTDEVYISKALDVFHRQGKFLNLSFSILPCNGSANLKMMSQKFHPRPNQMMIALFDDDGAGWKAICEALGLDEKDRKKFGSAQKSGDIWYAFIPTKRNKGNFNIEDYFDRSVFLKLVMSFKVLNDIAGKDALKHKLAELCTNNKINDNKFKKFAQLFKLLDEIIQAEADGKTKL